MRTTTMPEIRMRPKHQVTLPASVVRQANFQVDDRLSVTFVNGTIMITRKEEAIKQPKPDIMSYAGIGRGIWGDTHEEVMETVNNLRKNQWER